MRGEEGRRRGRKVKGEEEEERRGRKVKGGGGRGRGVVTPVCSYLGFQNGASIHHK